MPEEFATKRDMKDLRTELFGDYPRRDKDDIGRVGGLEKAMSEMPAVVKKEINAAMMSWRGLALAAVSIGTFLILVYKTFFVGQ